MSDPAIKRHWVVCAFTPDETGETLGSLGPQEGELYETEAAAKDAAKTFAAASPGSYHVVYQAMWYAFTDVTPVTLLRVGLPS